MSLKMHKALTNLPISLRILCGFLCVCGALTATSAVVYYRHSRQVVIDSLQRQAFTLCEYAGHKFDMHYATPIDHELHLLATSPELDNYLKSSKEELLVRRAGVEKLFLSLSQGHDIHLSTAFLDMHGQEKIGVCGNTRTRTFRSLAQIEGDGPVGWNMVELFRRLKSSGTPLPAYTAPFYDAEHRLGILVGMARQEPEAGGFGGVLIRHCDLTAFVHEVSQNRILDTAVMWVYGSDEESLSSPPEGEVRRDPRPYLIGEKGLVGSSVYAAACNLFDSEKPVLTVVCSIPPEIISKELAPIVSSVIVIFSVLLGGAAVSSLLISHWVSKPIKGLTRAVMNVSVQRLDLDLDVKLTESKDEIGILAGAFRKMLRDLKDSTTSIDNLNLEITQRKQAEEELQALSARHEAILTEVPDIIAEVDANKVYTWMNQAGLEFFGAEALGKEAAHYFEGEQNTYEVVQPVFCGDPSVVYVETWQRRRDGEKRILAWWCRTLVDVQGNVTGALSTARDITERKQAEEQQTQLLQKLSEINQELKDFAYVVSHDLKAPLRAIKTLAEWLAADYRDKLDEQGKENLQLLGQRVDRMHNLIDGVLQYSRIGRTEQKASPVDLSLLLPEIIDNLGVPAHIAIRVEPDLPTIEADPTRITQVLQNLLSNAVKYMDKPQGSIAVDCVPEDGFWKFSVADNGPGIEQKYFERIFKLFQTLTRRDDCESTGVGLTVAKKIVEMYGGRIWVESEVGQGSTFFFTFPRSTERVVEETLPTCAVGR
jgi:two-component system sensor kinase FixL